ncbi:hypothetical protein BLA29_014872 [Euroglyphus maynei]|uniref:Dolichol phosphate-mannose biosynthesis regulatory protein n=1 Tax=Euroglyphus maynei TaxID=6958 RepID=A0A1Y3BDE4_EURMA|nr:hypothetical protein BLA29_014872 [Euroglyphus maynei]
MILAGYDRPLGIIILFITSSILIYYSLWIILVPLLYQNHIVARFFPAKISFHLLLGIPVAIITTLKTYKVN